MCAVGAAKHGTQYARTSGMSRARKLTIALAIAGIGIAAYLWRRGGDPAHPAVYVYLACLAILLAALASSWWRQSRRR